MNYGIAFTPLVPAIVLWLALAAIVVVALVLLLARARGAAVRVPSLMIMAENDAVLPPSAADGMEKLIPDLEKHLVKGSGHWTQQEKPEEVSAKLIEWRRRRFG